MSLSTTKSHFAGLLHEIADLAYFRRTVLVASAHNMPVESYVAVLVRDLGGQPRGARAQTFYYNPSPPVEFFARGVDVESPGSAAPGLARPGTASRHPMCRDLRADPRQASGADAVPAEERALSDRYERGRPGWLIFGRPLRRGARLGGGAPSVAPGDRRGRPRNFPREGGVGLPLRRRDGRARLRGGRRRGSDTLIGQRLPSSTGIAGWVW